MRPNRQLVAAAYEDQFLSDPPTDRPAVVAPPLAVKRSNRFRYNLKVRASRLSWRPGVLFKLKSPPFVASRKIDLC